MCAELVLIQNPSTQATHLKTIVDLQEKAAKQLKEERELSKQEAEKSRQHGAEVGKELSTGLKEVANAATELKFTFQAEQEKTRENNNRLHAERMKAEQERANK